MLLRLTNQLKSMIFPKTHFEICLFSGQQRTLRHVPSLATLNRIERDNLSLLKAPIRTIHYASAELIYLLYEFLLL